MIPGEGGYVGSSLCHVRPKNEGKVTKLQMKRGKNSAFSRVIFEWNCRKIWKFRVVFTHLWYKYAFRAGSPVPWTDMDMVDYPQPGAMMLGNYKPAVLHLLSGVILKVSGKNTNHIAGIPLYKIKMFTVKFAIPTCYFGLLKPANISFRPA